MMECFEYDRLRIRYDGLLRAYMGAIRALGAAENAPEERYRRLRQIADDARLEAELARLELEYHRRTYNSDMGYEKKALTRRA